ncbi:adenylyltransferase/cytidyltransferase family protein [Candidatus Microgenomates bacterium]|nr:adenylyltransferase/cytidyltransferase family protein [Candidatus Microgenomates bacterium]
MTNKIVSIEEAEKISKQLKEAHKTIVLAGGCFDILHKGHLAYLKKAGKQGDVLFVALESDSNVRRLKGNKRPINNQQQRAIQLTKLSAVDYIILLPSLLGYRQYFDITQKLSPHIIAITEGDSKKEQKEIQAAAIEAKVVAVVKRFPEYSTTDILQEQ